MSSDIPAAQMKRIKDLMGILSIVETMVPKISFNTTSVHQDLKCLLDDGESNPAYLTCT